MWQWISENWHKIAVLILVFKEFKVIFHAVDKAEKGYNFAMKLLGKTHLIKNKKSEKKSDITFDINSAYQKLYDADGKKEVILTEHEADELLDWMQHMFWLTNKPEEK